jgi:hypothetical protein
MKIKKHVEVNDQTFKEEACYLLSLRTLSSLEQTGGYPPATAIRHSMRKDQEMDYQNN